MKNVDTMTAAELRELIRKTDASQLSDSALRAKLKPELIRIAKGR